MLESFPPLPLPLDQSGSAVVREVWSTESSFTGKPAPCCYQTSTKYICTYTLCIVFGQFEFNLKQLHVCPCEQRHG